MFSQTFKNIDDVLWKEAGCSSELDYTEQSSWMLFLKYLDDLEQERMMRAELEGKSYTFIIDSPYQWSQWAAPKKDGAFDHDTALTGDDLIAFVDNQLFPYLKGFKQRASATNTIEYKIGEIFNEIKNKFQSGYSLRDALELMDQLTIRSQVEKHELSALYEEKIKNMGNAGRNGGEYYTPRPLIRAMIAVTKPQIGERIYDGAVGSAGFLCEAHDYLRHPQDGSQLTTSQLETLQTKTFYGKEKKSLAYVIAIMNMILHGIDAPNIVHTNTLAENISDIQEKDRHHVILANPPFGGKERKEVQQNFPIKTGETAFLFLQHFIKSLKAGGRAAVVIKNTFLSNSDNASKALRQELLESCNLHTVLDCPAGTFLGAGVKTVVIFFDKGAPTRKTWYYQLDPGRKMGKTNALNDGDLHEFVELQASFADSDKSWSVDVQQIDQSSFDLSVKNPNRAEEVPLREPQVILDEIVKLDAESAKILAGIDAAVANTENNLANARELFESTLNGVYTQKGDGWVEKKLGVLCERITKGSSPKWQGIAYVDKPGVLFVTSENVGCNQLLFNKTKYVEEAFNQKGPKSILKRGDVLTNIVGASIGRTAVFDRDDLANINQAVCLIRCEPDKLINTYLAYLLNSPFFRQILHDNEVDNARANLSLGFFKGLSIPVPPVETQMAIVAEIDMFNEQTQHLELIYQQKLKSLAEFKQSILQKAFAGQLTTRPGKIHEEAAS